MPLLHSLVIWECDNLKSLPDYLRNAPSLEELEIKKMHEEANIDSDYDLESFFALAGGANSDSDDDSDKEAHEAANAEDSDEHDSSITTFTTARLDVANAGGGSQHEDQDGESEIENSDGTKDSGA